MRPSLLWCFWARSFVRWPSIMSSMTTLVAFAVGAAVGGEVQTEGDLVGNLGNGVVGQGLGQGVGGLGADVGELADVEAVPLLGDLAHDIADGHAGDLPATPDGFAGEVGEAC